MPELPFNRQGGQSAAKTRPKGLLCSPNEKCPTWYLLVTSEEWPQRERRRRVVPSCLKMGIDLQLLTVWMMKNGWTKVIIKHKVLVKSLVKHKVLASNSWDKPAYVVLESWPAFWCPAIRLLWKDEVKVEEAFGQLPEFHGSAFSTHVIIMWF